VYFVSFLLSPAASPSLPPPPQHSPATFSHAWSQMTTPPEVFFLAEVAASHVWRPRRRAVGAERCVPGVPSGWAAGTGALPSPLGSGRASGVRRRGCVGRALRGYHETLAGEADVGSCLEERGEGCGSRSRGSRLSGRDVGRAAGSRRSPSLLRGSGRVGCRPAGPRGAHALFGWRCNPAAWRAVRSSPGVGPAALQP